MNSAERIIAPFPAKENSDKSTMPSSSTSTPNAQLRFDPKFNNLPAPSDDYNDSGVYSYRSEHCCSGGLEESLRSLSLGQDHDNHPKSGVEEHHRIQTEHETSGDAREDEKEGAMQLTPNAFDQDQEGDTPLHMSIIHEDKISLQFIKYAPSIHHLNIANNLLQTPLHLSVHTRQVRVCRALVVAGAPLETMDRNGNTALHLACSQGKSECVKALTQRVTHQELHVQQLEDTRCKTTHVQLPQDLELRNFNGYTCMHLAAASHNTELVCYLRSIGGHIDAPDGKSGRTPLHYAVENNNYNLVQYLISLGANVNALTFDNCSPLHIAVGRGQQRITLLLLDRGADVNVINSEGFSPEELATTQHSLMFLHQQPEYNDFKLQGM